MSSCVSPLLGVLCLLSVQVPCLAEPPWHAPQPAVVGPLRDVPPQAAGAAPPSLSGAPGERFGAALASTDDHDGDGVPDVLVGAWRADGPGLASGRVSWHSGRDGHELLAWQGDHPGDRLGWALSALGDVDGDGVGDLALAAPAGDPPAGSVRLVSGVDGRLLRTFVGGEDGERFGHALAALGDVDGDGRADLAIAAPESDAGGLLSGRVVVVSGGSGALLWVRAGAAFERFGQALAAVGDVDGDGRCDLAIGAPLADDGAFNGGRALLCSGADGAPLGSWQGAGIGDQLGQWLAGPGDLDLDGEPELVVAVPGADGTLIDAGRVDVVDAQGGGVLWSVHGVVAGEGLGLPARVGDVDGDGGPDLAVGSALAGGPGWGAGVPHGGRVTLHHGMTGELLATRWGRRPWGWAGFALTAVRDQGRDARGEVLIGAPGHDDVLDIPGEVRSWSLSGSGTRSW